MKGQGKRRLAKSRETLGTRQGLRAGCRYIGRDGTVFTSARLGLTLCAALILRHAPSIRSSHSHASKKREGWGNPAVMDEHPRPVSPIKRDKGGAPVDRRCKIPCPSSQREVR